MKTLITGTNTGLGKALVERFSLEGKVIDGNESGDLRDEEVCNRLSRIGFKEDIDVLINYAGLYDPHVELEKMTYEERRNLYDYGLIIPIEITRLLLPHFKCRKKGAIININSFVGIEPKRNRGVYSATRGGLRWFTESLRFEARDNNVLIMGVYPTQIIENYKDVDVGLHAKDVANFIIEGYKNKVERLIIDNRPNQIRIQELKKHCDIKEKMLKTQQLKGNERLFWTGRYWGNIEDELLLKSKLEKLCPLSKRCYMFGEVPDCERDYERCELYQSKITEV